MIRLPLKPRNTVLLAWFWILPLIPLSESLLLAVRDCLMGHFGSRINGHNEFAAKRKKIQMNQECVDFIWQINSGSGICSLNPKFGIDMLRYIQI